VGDRGHIALNGYETEPSPVWLYSHWGGSALPELARKGLLAAVPRLGDPHYAALMFVMEATSYEGLSGIGVSSDDTGDGGRIVYVDLMTGKVTLEMAGEVVAEFDREEYVALTEATWDSRPKPAVIRVTAEVEKPKQIGQ
jgi:hypothetical protein